jgi:hypothetical protein
MDGILLLEKRKDSICMKEGRPRLFCDFSLPMIELASMEEINVFGILNGKR